MIEKHFGINHHALSSPPSTVLWSVHHHLQYSGQFTTIYSSQFTTIYSGQFTITYSGQFTIIYSSIHHHLLWSVHHHLLLSVHHHLLWSVYHHLLWSVYHHLLWSVHHHLLVSSLITTIYSSQFTTIYSGQFTTIYHLHLSIHCHTLCFTAIDCNIIIAISSPVIIKFTQLQLLHAYLVIHFTKHYILSFHRTFYFEEFYNWFNSSPLKPNRKISNLTGLKSFLLVQAMHWQKKTNIQFTYTLINQKLTCMKTVKSTTTIAVVSIMIFLWTCSSLISVANENATAPLRPPYA